MVLKKKWYDIESPGIFGNMIVGETVCVDPKHLIGRKVEVSLIDVSGEFKKFYLKLYFKVTGVDETRCKTEFIGHDVFRERIYRTVQRRGRRIDSIDDVETSDGVKIRLKTIGFIGRRVQTSIKEKIRKKMSETIKKLAEKKTLNDLVRMIISGDIEKRVKRDCKKIYPIGVIEVHKSEVLAKDKKQKNPEKNIEKEERIETIPKEPEISAEKVIKIDEPEKSNSRREIEHDA